MIDNYGISLVVDQSTRCCILACSSNETGKIISAALLDTYVYLYPKINERQYPIETINETWMMCWEYDLIETTAPNAQLCKFRELALLWRKGVYVLARQSAILNTAYDHIGELNMADLDAYMCDKRRYVAALQQLQQLTEHEATRRLEFCCEFLQAIRVRVRALYWEFLPKLYDVSTQAEYLNWRDEVLNQTINYGKV